MRRLFYLYAVIPMLIFGLLLFCIGCASQAEAPALPYYRTPDWTPQWINPAAHEALHRVGAFSLINQQGETITRADVAGSIYVASFFFARCAGICPRLRTSLARVQQAFAEAEDVLLLSHTVKPGEDTVEALHHYAQVNAVRPGKWHLLTGERDAIYTLAAESYFIDLPALGSDFFHTELFVLVDRDGHLRGVYNGTLAFDIERLIEDITMLRGEGPVSNAGG